MIALCSILSSFFPLVIEAPVRLSYFSLLIIKNVELEHFLLCLAVCELFPWYVILPLWTSQYLIPDLKSITCTHTSLQSAASQLHLLVTSGLVRWGAIERKHLPAHLKLQWVRNIVFVQGILPAYLFHEWKHLFYEKWKDHYEHQFKLE